MKMWKMVQSFDTQRLLLSHFEGSAEARKQWQEQMEWLIPTELDQKALFSDLIAGFHDASRSMQEISRNNCQGLVMQSYNFYKYLTVNKGLVDVEQIMQLVDEEHATYRDNDLFHCTDSFNADHPQITIADKLRCLENFDRIDLLPI
jgi:hypothetical protein